MNDDREPRPDSEDPGQPLDATVDADPDATLADATVDSAPGEQPGTRIGRYRLIRPLGEGGFGTVFLAEQFEPVSRQVALKIIKLGMDTKQVIARFEAERQALAMMDHPGIAKVFDAGATDAGRPYFVMELVQGEPITDYCDQRRLDTRRRLDLFNQVCAAVQHAHQKGIIHRDIKPSNVLVTETDGQAVPKVIDFGIAKATNQRLTEKTIFTQEAAFIGTPAYMSPEQAEISELDVDTRSDIYSLGVLLYQLLSGETPFDGSELLSAGYGEIQRIIREVDPPLPSSRVSQLGERLEPTAESRKLRGPQLVKHLKGDLDWIVMKCLEKDRNRRYETANGLARDVDRYLSDEPVTASPPSRSYRLRKLIARNRAVFAAGLAMVLLLGAGVVGTSIGLVRAKRAEREAVIEAAKSDQVATFLTDMLTGVGPSAARGRDTEMLEEILQETHEKLGAELAGQPEVEGEIRSFLGTTYFDLGQFEKALEQYEKARDLLIEALGEADTDVALQYNNLGLTYEALQDFEPAEENFRHALALRIELFGEAHADVGASKLYLANLLVNDARYDEAEPLLREALEIQRATQGPDHEHIAISLNSLGNLMQHLGRFEEAGPYYEDALAMHIEVLGADHPFVITDQVNMGWLHYNLGEYEAAAEDFTAAEVVGRRVYGDAHPQLARIIETRAGAEKMLGHDEVAEALYREAWDMAAEIHGPDDLQTATYIKSLSELLVDTGRWREGVEVWERVYAIQTAQLGEHHLTTVTTLHNISYAYLTHEDYDEAVRRLRMARNAYLAAFGREDGGTAHGTNSLARALHARGDLEEAEALFKEAAAIRSAVFGEDHLMVHISHFDMTLLMQDQGRLEEADALTESVIAGYAASLDSTHWALGRVVSESANLKLALDRPGEAFEPARRGRDIVVAAKGEDSDTTLHCEVVLITALGRSGDLAGADARLAVITPYLETLMPRKRALEGISIGRHRTLAGHHDEAERELLSAHEVLLDVHGEDHFATRRAVEALVELYEDWGVAGSSNAERAAARWREGAPVR